MYYFLVIASQLLLLSFSESQHVFELKYSPPWHDRPAMRYTVQAEEKCIAKTADVSKYPYYAGIVSVCYEARNKTKVPVSTQRFGFIISQDYVLSPLDESMYTEEGCDNTVQILSSDSTHKAKLIMKSTFAFYKLVTPIEFGPQAQPVMIIDEQHGPKPGDKAVIVGLSYNSSSDKFGVIELGNVTLINDRETRRILFHFQQTIPFATHDDFVWFNYPEQPCLHNIFFTSMFVGNRLVAMNGTPLLNYNGRRLQGYYSVAQHRGAIRKLTGA